MRTMRIIFNFAFVLQLNFLLYACSNEKVCPGCSGDGTFVDGDNYITCQYCNGSGKISPESYELLTSRPKVSYEPVKAVKYCNICNGTGKFHAPRSIIVTDCNICNGKGVADDDRYNTTASLYTCIDCGGQGKNPWDGTNCYSCNGTGLSRMSVVNQINSNPARARGNLCGACGGKTTCPVCHGYCPHDYGDIQYCSSCGNTGKCKWCYGRGY